ncbi:hypothetical protein MVEN_01626100 [Mycena venus]|uniref:Ubiquitin-like domain-containing protein n=1 Tax=Mycena venus TaxID=2733690 RepID=A0A8H6XQK2_9AGAR|nr:hypothetical protein MVEN_01626100 [Mycena venus]
MRSLASATTLDMPSAVAFALTFGSFGDILEAAKIAKQILDFLRTGSAGTQRVLQRRKAVILTLEGLCNDMAALTLFFHEGRFTDRLWVEVHLCRDLVDEFYAQIKPYQATGLRGYFNFARMVALEERQLASWGARISQRRGALHDLLLASNSMQLHELGDQLGRVGSQVHGVGSQIDRVGARVDSVGTLGVLMSAYLSTQVSRTGSEIRQAVSEMREVQTEIIAKMSVHDIREPVFFVIDPVGGSISIPLVYFTSFDDLDRILYAYLANRPEAGGRYVARGDYSVVSTQGDIITRTNIRAKVRVGVQFDISIIKRPRHANSPEGTRQMTCPQCGEAGIEEGNWAVCTGQRCGARYQSSPQFVKPPRLKLRPDRTSTIEEVFSPQISAEEHQEEKFRLIQVVYKASLSVNLCPNTA